MIEQDKVYHPKGREEINCCVPENGTVDGSVLVRLCNCNLGHPVCKKYEGVLREYPEVLFASTLEGHINGQINQ